MRECFISLGLAVLGLICSKFLTALSCISMGWNAAYGSLAGFDTAVRRRSRWPVSGDSPIEGSLWRPKPWPGRADAGVLNWLRLPRRIAVAGSSALAKTADSTIGVATAAMGVLPSSPSPLRNLALACASPPKEVMSFSAEFFAKFRCGPWLNTGGDNGGLSNSGTVCVILGKLSCWADGDVQVSEDSRPVQAKLQKVSGPCEVSPDLRFTYHRIASCC